MSIELSEDRRTHLVQRLQGYHAQEFDEELSVFQAENLLDWFLERLGPPIYNQAVQDVRKYLQQRLDDLEGDVHAPEVL